MRERNNLPPESQAWARAVERSITDLERNAGLLRFGVRLNSAQQNINATQAGSNAQAAQALAENPIIHFGTTPPDDTTKAWWDTDTGKLFRFDNEFLSGWLPVGEPLAPGVSAYSAGRAGPGLFSSVNVGNNEVEAPVYSVVLGPRHAVGPGAVSSVTIGDEITNETVLSVVLGNQASSTGGASTVVVGEGAVSEDTSRSVVLGYGARVGNASATLVLGEGAEADGTSGSVVLGNQASDVGDEFSGASDNLILGAGAHSTTGMTGRPNGATAIGPNAEVSASNSVAIGPSAHAGFPNAVCIGRNGEATGSSSLSLGFGTNVSGHNAVGLGYQAEASGSGALGAGRAAVAEGDNSLAIGRGAHTTDADGLAVGYNASTEGEAYQNIAVGNSARATHERSIALGFESETTADDQTKIRADEVWVEPHAEETPSTVVLHSPDGTPWRISVDNTGTISANAV